MKTNEHEIFDELMRQKLGDYAEAPDMELLNNIQRKKNRLIKHYGLYKMFAIICFAGLGIFASYLLIQPDRQLNSGNQQQNNVQHTPSANGQGSFNAAHHLNNANTRQEGVSNTGFTSTTGTNRETHTAIPVNVQKTSKNLHNTIKNNESFKTTHDQNHTSLHAKNKNDQSIKAQQPVTAQPGMIQSEQKSTANPADVKDNGNIPKDEKGKANTEKDKSTSSSCKAAFDYYASYDGQFNFTNFSEAEATASLVWDFGDGSTTEVNAPVHQYTQSGMYTVTLNITDKTHSCETSFQKIIAFGTKTDQKNNGIAIKGRVLGNSEPVAQARVKLLVYHRETNAYEFAVRTVASLSGEYTFDKLKPGRYLVIAEGNNNDYLPTYLGNTLSVENAEEVAIMENDNHDLSGYNISLMTNTIIRTGDISRTYNDTDGILLVMDQNNNVVGIAKVDDKGHMSVDGLPPGDYSVINQQTGNTSKLNIKGDVSNSTGAGTNRTVPNAALNNSITLVPNPAVNDFQFAINANSEEHVEVTIINSSGSTVYHNSYTCSNGYNPMNINIYKLPVGVYYVVVNVGGKQTMSGRLVKKADDDR